MRFMFVGVALDASRGPYISNVGGGIEEVALWRWWKSMFRRCLPLSPYEDSKGNHDQQQNYQANSKVPVGCGAHYYPCGFDGVWATRVLYNIFIKVNFLQTTSRVSPC